MTNLSRCSVAESVMRRLDGSSDYRAYVPLLAQCRRCCRRWCLRLPAFTRQGSLLSAKTARQIFRECWRSPVVAPGATTMTSAAIGRNRMKCWVDTTTQLIGRCRVAQSHWDEKPVSVGCLQRDQCRVRCSTKPRCPWASDYRPALTGSSMMRRTVIRGPPVTELRPHFPPTRKVSVAPSPLHKIER